MLKPKKGIVILDNPATGWEYDSDWKEFRTPDGSYIERKYVQVHRGRVVGLHPDLAKKYGLKTVGDIGQGTNRQKAKEERRKIVDELNAELKKVNAEYAVFLIRSGEALERKVRMLLKEGKNDEAEEVKETMRKEILEKAGVMADRIREINEKIESHMNAGV